MSLVVSPLPPQPSTSFASSPSRSVTSLRLGVPYWRPPVEQTCHTGGTGGGVDSPPPVLLCCLEGVIRKIVPLGFSMRTLSPCIPPQGASIGKWYPEMTPCTFMVSHPYPNFLSTPPPYPSVGRWGGPAMPNSVLSLLMGSEQPSLQVKFALGEMDPLAESIPIGESPSRHLPSVGLCWLWGGGVTWPAVHDHRIPKLDI